MGSVDVERAHARAPSFGEGFVDISMYVVLDIPSKNAAGMRPDNLRRIFRKLRLAVFGRICRLPIGLGKPLGMHEALVSRFEVPNVWHRKRDCGRRGWHCAAVATHSRGHISGHFWPQGRRNRIIRGENRRR